MYYTNRCSTCRIIARKRRNPYTGDTPPRPQQKFRCNYSVPDLTPHRHDSSTFRHEFENCILHPCVQFNLQRESFSNEKKFQRNVTWLLLIERIPQNVSTTLSRSNPTRTSVSRANVLGANPSRLEPFIDERAPNDIATGSCVGEMLADQIRALCK